MKKISFRDATVLLESLFLLLYLILVILLIYFLMVGYHI